jgi:DNA invertase Pin-like site-specific DNA recombinase
MPRRRQVLDLLRPHDKLVVYALDRLARSQLHLLQIVDEIETKGAMLVSLRESIDTSSAVGRFFIGVLGSLAAMERELIIERSRNGVALARERKVKFGRPTKLTPALLNQVTLAHENHGTTASETCRLLGISKNVVKPTVVSLDGAAQGRYWPRKASIFPCRHPPIPKVFGSHREHNEPMPILL